jgi:TPP-dependent 2-oxoacid decarboxylase
MVRLDLKPILVILNNDGYVRRLVLTFPRSMR